MTKIDIRPCKTTEEMEACVQLQAEVWGFKTEDLVPRRIFVVASKIGGQVIGAFDGPTLAGFAMAVPGIRSDGAYLHSHMLAVREDYRDGGIGRRLKLFQRDDAINRNIALMEWTFDPLELKNAYFNIAKLGAIVRRYTHSFYGLTSSALQAGLPTDRLHAEWWLQSPRVESFLAGHPDKGHPDKPTIVKRVAVPAAVADWKQEVATRQQALDVQSRVADELETAFAQGLAIVGFSRDPIGDGVYELGPAPEEI
jgi:predicted GNAT superfamily acetyltransferase